MLKALHAGDQEFEVILDNGESNHFLRDEVVILRARCTDLESSLKSAEESVTAGADGHLKTRCDALEESLAAMKQQYEEECERRKEAEQVFSTINEKPEEVVSHPTPPSRTFFGRNKMSSPELTDTDVSTKKSSRWLSIRGRKKKDDTATTASSQTYHPRDVRDYEHRDEAEDSTVRSPRYTYTSPRQRAQGTAAPSSRTRVAFGTSPEAILSQIPTHIKSNFMEVGFYKQRQQNNFLPVLCLGPFDVPPGPIRDEWLSKFNKSSKVLNMGVYFLGRDGQDEGAYGTIPWFSFVPYAKAAQRGLNVVPQDIAEKIENGADLSSEELQLYDGIQQVTEAADMMKEERTHPLKHLNGQVPKCITADVSNKEVEDDLVSEMGPEMAPILLAE